MICQLMKRDPAWRAVPWLLSFAVVLWTIALTAPDAQVTAITGAAFSGLMTFALVSAVQQDVWSSLLSALPVRPAQIFLARVLAMAALVWLPSLVGLVAIKLATPNPLTGPYVALAAYAWFVAVCVQAGLMTGTRLPRQVAIALVFCSLLVPSFFPVLFMPGRRYELPAAALCIVLAVAVAVRAWRTVDGKPLALSRRATAAPSDFHRSLTDSAHIHFLGPRFLFLWTFSWTELVWLPVLFVQAFTGSWTTALLFLWSPRITPTRLWLDPFPVARRTILLAGILPLLFAVSAGYLAGTEYFSPERSRNVGLSATQDWPPRWARSCGQLNVVPPLDYWELARKGDAPAVRAPWGETFTPPVLTILGTRVYNPYAVGCANSRRFLEWQVGRATAAAGGRAVSLAEFERHGFRIARQTLRMRIVNLGALLACAMLVFITVALKDWYRWKRLSSMGRWGGLAVVVAFFGATVVAFVISPYTHQEALQAISWALPGNLAAVAILAATIPLLLYLLLEKLAREAELPSRPSQTVRSVVSPSW